MRKSLTLLGVMAVLMFVATGCYEVEYTMEYKDSCIKFEDAMFWDEDRDPDPGLVDACLGEDGVVETDTFYVEVGEQVGKINVTVKAGGGKGTEESDDVPVGGQNTVGTFSVEVNHLFRNIYEIKVTSDDANRTAALSHITFCFGEAEVVDGSASAVRFSPDREPTEPEEEDDD